jgi:hypothetical protein
MVVILPPREDAIQRQALAKLVEKALGRPLDIDKFEGLFSVQKEMRFQQSLLVAEFDRKALSSEGYLERLSNLTLSATTQIRTLLGDELFIKIFGEAGLHPEGIVNRQKFFEIHGKNLPAPSP